MGERRMYYVPEWNTNINGWIATESGEFKKNPIKLISLALVRNKNIFPSSSMKGVFKQVLKGKNSEWELMRVDISVYGGVVVLKYNPPAGVDDRYGSDIEFNIENVAELRFEVERGEGIPPDRYWMNGTRQSWDLSMPEGTPYSDQIHRAAFVELLNGGLLRRTSGVYREQSNYLIVEERF